MALMSKTTPTDPELARRLRESAETVKAMTPEERGRMHGEQRRSWVRGEMMLQYPEMTFEEADRQVRQVELETGAVSKENEHG